MLQNEIFDMVKPKDPYKITLQDLVNRCAYYFKLFVIFQEPTQRTCVRWVRGGFCFVGGRGIFMIF